GPVARAGLLDPQVGVDLALPGAGRGTAPDRAPGRVAPLRAARIVVVARPVAVAARGDDEVRPPEPARERAAVLDHMPCPVEVAHVQREPVGGPDTGGAQRGDQPPGRAYEAGVARVY